MRAISERRKAAFVLLILLAWVTWGNAATSTWKGTSGTWEDSANWTGGVPVASSTAILDNGGFITVANGTAAVLLVGTSNGGSGSVQMSSGSLSVTSIYLGNVAGSSGSAVITGGTCLAGNYFYIGNSGTGGLTVSGSGMVIAHSDGNGQLLLASNSTASATLNIGTGGSAGTIKAEAITGGDGTATVNFNHAGIYTFGVKMTGNQLSVNKLGSGTTVLTANNTYKGLTKVSAGELDVNGSLSTSGTVRVEMGATLGGSGTAGNVYAYGGTIKPSAGNALSLASLTLTSTSTLVSTITSATALGQVKVSGAVSLSGTLSLFGLSYLTKNLPVTLIDETGTSLLSGSFGTVTVSGSRVSLTALDSDSFIFTSNSLLYELDYNSGSGGRDLMLTLIPEPPQAVLLMSGVCLLCCVRRILRPRYL